jgi:pregnancy-associated plasma protein-A
MAVAAQPVDDPSMSVTPKSMPRPGVVMVVLMLALTAGVSRASAETSLGPSPEFMGIAATPDVPGSAAVQAASARRARACGTPEALPAETEGVRLTLRRWVEENAAVSRGGTIRVAFHVITSKGEGDLSDAQIADQMQELNRNFAGSGYRFELVRVDRTEDQGWFRMIPGSGAERRAKQALAVEPARHLNIYVCKPGQNLLGWAYLPWAAPEEHYIHGIVVDYTSLPGGEAPYDLGRTATHEVGHYLGLFHTFQRGCTAPGDEVDDTPFEATPAFGCEIGRNTCPAPGDDPVTNYMDYSDDACYEEFSAGQQDRMHAIVSVYKPSLFSQPIARAALKPEISPTAGAEPEEGRVLSYRGGFPNPFRAETAIRFTLPTSQPVSLRIYSVTGQLVRTLVDTSLPPGDHSAMFRAGGLPSGAYFAVLKAGHVQMSRTLMLVR